MSNSGQVSTNTSPDHGATKWKNFISISGFCVSFPEDWHQLQGAEYTRSDEYVFSPTPEKKDLLVLIQAKKMTSDVTLEQDMLRCIEAVQARTDIFDFSFDTTGYLSEFKANKTRYKMVSSARSDQPLIHAQELNGRVIECMTIWTFHNKLVYQVGVEWEDVSLVDRSRNIIESIVQSFVLVTVPRKLRLLTHLERDTLFVVRMPSFMNPAAVPKRKNGPVLSERYAYHSRTEHMEMMISVSVEELRDMYDLDDYGDLLLLQLEKMLPNKETRVNMRRCRLDVEPARCVQFSTHRGDIYVQVFAIRNNKVFMVTFNATGVADLEVKDRCYLLFERVLSSFRFIADNDIEREQNEAALEVHYEDLVHKCGFKWRRDDYVQLDGFEDHVFHLVQKRNDALTIAEDAAYFILTASHGADKTAVKLEDLAVLFKQLNQAHFGSRGHTVQHEVDDHSQLAGLAARRWVLSAGEEKCLQKFALLTGNIGWVSLFFNTTALHWDEQFRQISRYFDSFYLFK